MLMDSLHHDRPVVVLSIVDHQTAMSRFQALYRGFSVRLSLRRAAHSSPLSTRAGGKDEGVEVAVASGRPFPGARDKAVPAARVRRDCAVRRRWEREAAIAETKRLEEQSNK